MGGDTEAVTASKMENPGQRPIVLERVRGRGALKGRYEFREQQRHRQSERNLAGIG